jgi:nucleoprotein TPR
MQETTELQTRMMEKCISQREHYKKLYNEVAKKGNVSKNSSMVDNFMDDETPSASNTSLNTAGLNSSIVTNKRVTELEQKIKDGEKDLKTLKEEYESYRKEKLHNDEMLNKQFDSLRAELREVSTLNCKLRAQVEHQDGQLKLQQKNAATYKKQIQTLEERNKNYESTIHKHETASSYLREQAFEAASKLSRAETIIEKMSQENRMLKDSESRLKAEREVLYRERQSSSLVLNNLELIKNSMERSESEGKMKMESRLDELTRECSALRRRLQEEQDRFRELSTHLERQTQTAKDKMEEEKALATKYREELDHLRADIERKSEKIDQLSKKLQESLTPTQGDNPVAQANKLRKEMEIRLNEVLIEKESLEKELVMAKEHSKQFCDMAESYEKQLNEINSSYSEYKSRVEADLSETKKSEANLRQRVNDLETEISLDINNRQLMAGDSSTQLHKVQLELKESLQKITENNRELREIREKNFSLSSALELAEQKYANEMILHSNDIKTMARLKEEMNTMSSQFEQLRLAKQSAEEKFNNGKTLWSEKQENLLKEKCELEERLADLDRQNAALHNQIQELSNKVYLNVSQVLDDSSIAVDADTSMNRSNVGDEEKPSEQLLQVIKYLRKEKDIAVAKFDILKSENVRLRSEMQLLQKRLDETLETSINQPDNTDTALNSARHEELLRKVETLNAITDSNRILREERDSLAIKFAALQERVTKVEDELVPLQEKNRELEAKSDSLTTENVSLKTEATRWRQRANALLERTNKNSPDDFKRLQNERENLAKMLQLEKDQSKKASEELQQIKQEKIKVDAEIANLQRQLLQQQNEIKRINEETLQQRQTNTKMSQELLENRVKCDSKEDEVKKLTEELTGINTQLTQLKDKEAQIRKIAKRYKDQFLELKEKVETGQTPSNVTEPSDIAMAGEASTSSGVVDISQLEAQVQQLSQELENTRNESSKLAQQNEELKAEIQKEESCKALLSQARTKFSSMVEKKDQITRELTSTKTQLEQMAAEHEQVIRNMKAQYEATIQRLQKEITDATSDRNEALQRFGQTQRPGQSSKPASSTMEKGPIDASSRTANVKPMAGPSQQSATVQPWRGSGPSGETPLASIRPISHQQSRTAAVMPTSIVQNLQGSSNETSASSSPQAGPSTALVPPQQQVHTTGAAQTGELSSSSPTSSHTDYMPTTSSATVVVAAVPPMGSSQNAAESSSQGQEEQSSSGESSIQVVTGGQPIAQAVALVSPRVEPQQPISQQNVEGPSTSAGSSSSSVSFSHTFLKHSFKSEKLISILF